MPVYACVGYLGDSQFGTESQRCTCTPRLVGERPRLVQKKASNTRSSGRLRSQPCHILVGDAGSRTAEPRRHIIADGAGVTGGADLQAAFTTQPISREFDEAGVKRDRRWLEELREREHVRNRPTRLLRPIRLRRIADGDEERRDLIVAEAKLT
jgi:hypothetical protein